LGRDDGGWVMGAVGDVGRGATWCGGAARLVGRPVYWPPIY